MGSRRAHGSAARAPTWAQPRPNCRARVSRPSQAKREPSQPAHARTRTRGGRHRAQGCVGEAGMRGGNQGGAGEQSAAGEAAEHRPAGVGVERD